MSAAWLHDYIRAWSADLHWTPKELADASEPLLAIARLNQAEVYGESAPTAEMRRAYMLERTRAALDALARSYARYVMGDDDVLRAPAPTTSFTPSLPFVSAQQYAAAVNVNTATIDELNALPGIGPVTAPRIVEYRRRYGSFASTGDLTKVKGLSVDAIKAMAGVAFAAPPSAGARITSPALDAFQRQPTFDTYVQALVAGGFGLSRFGPLANESAKERILRELRGLREEQEQRPYHPFRTMPGTSTAALRTRIEQRDAARKVAQGAIEGPVHGALLDDGEYPTFLLELFKVATQRIRIVMFFMRFDDEKAYPTDALFAELLAGKQRGVDIRVILDRDAEGDSIRSRVINDEAFRFLKKHGIRVVFDAVDRYTHTKLVTVDRRHVILGSHNWTAGSFYAYDDTSVYIESAGLAEHYDRQFDELWGDYDV